MTVAACGSSNGGNANQETRPGKTGGVLRQLGDPKVDSAMDAATKLQGAARLTVWGNIDKMITADAPAVPRAARGVCCEASSRGDAFLRRHS